MKHYLLRVGADKDKGGGFISPIFDDRSYKFIPIPDDKKDLILDRAITYKDFKWQNNSIVSFLPTRLSPRKVWPSRPLEQTIHNDPEFVTFTYGSPKYNQAGSKEKNYDTLLNMERGDILTFYAAFSSKDGKLDGLYFFAYFIIDTSICWGNLNELSQYDQVLVKNNHHFIHKRSNQVVVVGGPESRVLNKAVLLSLRTTDLKGTNYYPCVSIRENAKYSESMNMSSLRCLPGEVSNSFREYLDLHSA